jgi:predicted acyl esterase
MRLLILALAWAAHFDVVVPARDGVKLAATVSLPDGPGPWPVVLTRTPYGKDRIADGGAYLSAGYARVVQDVRGQFASEGKYRPFEDDLNDGYDTIEWIAAQPWSNRKVALVGASAGGITANLAAMSGAPHLVCAFVSVAHGSSYHYASNPGGLYLQHMNESWLESRGTLADTVRFRSYDARARSMDMRTYLGRITVPIFNVGGWYDIFSQGSIDAFVELQNDGGKGARHNQKLVMGAFGHGKLAGDLRYPPDAADHAARQRRRWLDYWMKGIDDGIMKEPPVSYYVMGDARGGPTAGNRWRSAEAWPPPSTAVSYYLAEDGSLSSTAPGSKDAALTYTYDPGDPVPTVGGNNLTLPSGPLDQRRLGDRPDVLRFQTSPLTEATEIAGKVEAELWVSTDAADTDFMVKLIDVYPDGYEALVLDQGLRLRHRDGFARESPVHKGQPYRITVDLWSTALVFDRGHRIAVQVSSSNAPRFEPHSNTWRPQDRAVVAHNTLYLNRSRPSFIRLPRVP